MHIYAIRQCSILKANSFLTHPLYVSILIKYVHRTYIMCVYLAQSPYTCTVGLSSSARVCPQKTLFSDSGYYPEDRYAHHKLARMGAN